MPTRMETALRKALRARKKTESLRSIAKGSGCQAMQVSRFIKREKGLTLSTAGGIAEYLGLELREKG